MVLAFLQPEVEEAYKQHHSRGRWLLDIVANLLSLFFGLVALPPLAARVTPLENVLFWSVVLCKITMLCLMARWPDCYLRHRERLVVAMSLLHKVAGVAGLRHIYMRDASPSWGHFAYSVIGFCGQWPMHFLLSLELQLRLKMHVLVHVTGLCFVFCANHSMAQHIMQVPENQQRWHRIAELAYQGAQQVWSRDALDRWGVENAISDESCCVFIWAVLQFVVGFALPTYITHRLEMKDRLRFQQRYSPSAEPLLDSHVANALPTIILSPFLVMLAFHQPQSMPPLLGV